MAVYVDDMRRRYRRMIMCHMLADTEPELHAMAAAIGVARRWYQGDHYDVCLQSRAAAVGLGAIEITQRAAVGVRRMFRSRNLDAGEIRCVHYVGFRDDRYWNAYRIWGGPRVIHRWWDKRAARDVGPNDVVIFAEGDWTQSPKTFNAPDIAEIDPAQ